MQATPENRNLVCILSRSGSWFCVLWKLCSDYSIVSLATNFINILGLCSVFQWQSDVMSVILFLRRTELLWTAREQWERWLSVYIIEFNIPRYKVQRKRDASNLRLIIIFVLLVSVIIFVYARNKIAISHQPEFIRISFIA